MLNIIMIYWLSSRISTSSTISDWQANNSSTAKFCNCLVPCCCPVCWKISLSEDTDLGKGRGFFISGKDGFLSQFEIAGHNIDISDLPETKQLLPPLMFPTAHWSVSSFLHSIAPSQIFSPLLPLLLATVVWSMGPTLYLIQINFRL